MHSSWEKKKLKIFQKDRDSTVKKSENGIGGKFYFISGTFSELPVILNSDLCETVRRENFRNRNSLQFTKNSFQMAMPKRFQNLFLMFLTPTEMVPLRLVFKIIFLLYFYVFYKANNSKGLLRKNHFENHNSLMNLYKRLQLPQNLIWTKNWIGLSNFMI